MSPFIGGDGAAMTAPRPRHKVFGAHSVLFHGRGEVIEAKILVMTPRKWAKSRWSGDKRFAVVRVGPLVVAVALTV